MIQVEDWRYHTLLEVSGILCKILEYSEPGEVICRLETIAQDLRNVYGDPGPLFPLSTHPEVNQLRKPYEP
jgi:hypothetical protein